MKHISQYLSIIALAISWSSCSDSQIADLDNSEKGVCFLQGTIAETAPATKTTLSGTTLSWAKNDAIGVLADEGIKKFLAQKAGKSVAFSGETVTNPQAAYYPYSTEAGDGIESNKLTLTLPAARSIVEGCTYSPMVATSYDGGFQFQHLCGLMSFTMENVPAGATLQIKSENKEQPVAGTFVVQDITDSDAALGFTSCKEGTTSTEVTYTFPNTVMKPEVIYLPLPVGTYDKLMVSLKEGERTLLTKSVSNLKIKKGVLVSLNTLNTFELKPSEAQAVLETYLKASATIKIQLLEEETDGEEMVVNIPKSTGSNSKIDFVIPKSYTKPLRFNELSTADDRKTSSTIRIYVPSASTEEVSTVWSETPAYSPVSDNRIIRIEAPTNANQLTIASYDKDKKIELKEIEVNNAAQTNISSPYMYVDKVTTHSGKTIQINGIVGTTENLSTTKEYTVKTAANGEIRPGYVYKVVGPTNSITSTFSWDGSTVCKPLKDDSGYIIRSVYELAYFLNNAIDDHIQLMQKATYNMGSKPWNGLVLPASKTFNGNGATVTGFTLVSDSSNGGSPSSGFIRDADKGSTIQDLTVIPTASTPQSKIGGLVGYCKSASITNCAIFKPKLDCSSNGEVNASCIGGLIGVLDASENEVSIQGCQAVYNSKSNYLKGMSCIGGMIGKVVLGSNNVTIEECVTYQNDTDLPIRVDTEALTALGVEDQKQYIGFNGRLVGTAEGSGTLTFKNCHNSSNKTITSSSYISLVDFSDALFSSFMCNSLTITEGETTKVFSSKGSAYIGRIPDNVTPTIIVQENETSKTWEKGTDYNVYQ